MLPRALVPARAPEELALGSACEGGAPVVGALPAMRAEEGYPVGAGRARGRVSFCIPMQRGAAGAHARERVRDEQTSVRRRLAWAADGPDGRYFAAAEVARDLRRWVKPRRTQA